MRSRSTPLDRKSTRLNSSHGYISYAVFCLNATPTTAIYTLSLHDALPIFQDGPVDQAGRERYGDGQVGGRFVDVDAADGIDEHVLLRGPEAAPAREDRQDEHHAVPVDPARSEEHTSELQSRLHLVCRLLLECYADHRDLHSFPTRRSSDLPGRAGRPGWTRALWRRPGRRKVRRCRRRRRH